MGPIFLSPVPEIHSFLTSLGLCRNFRSDCWLLSSESADASGDLSLGLNLFMGLTLMVPHYLRSSLIGVCILSQSSA